MQLKKSFGHGLKAEVNGKELLVGNFKLMDKFTIKYDIDPSAIVLPSIAIAYDKNLLVGLPLPIV